MLKDLFSNRLFIGALAIFIFCVGGSLLYMQHETQKGEKELAETQTHVEQWNEKQKQSTAEVPEGDTSQGGHWHGDEWHGEPHETPVDRPVLPPLEAQEIPKFVKPVSDSQDVTIADRVIASGAVPDRAAFEAMTNEQLSELVDESYEKTRKLLPKLNNAISEWAKVVSDLTRHVKTRAERDAILVEHADTVQPLREAMETTAWETNKHRIIGNRAFKISQARFFITARDFVDQESLTDEFWTAFWSDF